MVGAPERPLETTWEDWVLGGGVGACFADPGLALEVEIGPGEDDFLLERALARPDRNWLGIEYSSKRVRRYVRKVRERAGSLANLRLIWRPAADLVGPFLSPARVRTYHVYFPDPWPKKHHHRYRMLTPAFLADLRTSLAPGGEILVLTDHREYAEEVIALARQVPGLHSVLPPPGIRTIDDRPRATVFEARWRARGSSIFGLHLCAARTAP